MQDSALPIPAGMKNASVTHNTLQPVISLRQRKLLFPDAAHIENQSECGADQPGCYQTVLQHEAVALGQQFSL